MRDAGVVGEGGVESRALGFAQGSEVWVMDLVVGVIEIVITLCMADAVDGDFAHAGGCSNCFFEALLMEG